MRTSAAMMVWRLPPNSPPARFHVGDSLLYFVDGQSRAEFEHANVVRFNERFQGGKVDGSSARGAMIAARKLHVVNVESGK